MTKIDIISGFLGAGKTTLIKRLLKTRLSKENVVLIENEFGEIGIDSGFLQDTKIDIKELNQGCICCSLQGDFAKALKEVMNKFNPDRIIIEPSGVGKLSDIVKAVVDAKLEGAELNALVCVCDASKAKMYLKNFGEFYIDQVKHAKTIFLSRADVASETKMNECLEIVRSNNSEAVIVTTSIQNLDDEELLSSYEAQNVDFEKELLEEVKHMVSHHHHHHDEDECDDEECECHHHHHDEDECDDEECECHHHHHDEDECDDEECECHHHHHDEDECDDPECECHHHHHHDHDADEVFKSFGIETALKFDRDHLEKVLNEIAEGEHGVIIRAKGIVEGTNGWIHFDLTPGEVELRDGAAANIGKICVIGSKFDKKEIKDLFLNK